MITLPTPSINGDTAEIQVAQLKSYIIQLVDSLQYSLNNIGIDSLDSNAREIISTLVSSVGGEE